MPKLRVHNYCMSIDGFVAGPDQSLENPMGVGGMKLHEWVFETEGGRQMIGQTGGSTGVDNDFFRAGTEGIGATIMGRNMFGPVRGPWPDDSWIGWWEDEPPFHHDVFVLTHHARDDLALTGTTFHFVTGGIKEAYDRAFAAANGQDVRLGGGAETVRAYLQARLVDELHIPVVPALLGSGERILDGLEGYEVGEYITTPDVLHVRITRSS